MNLLLKWFNSQCLRMNLKKIQIFLFLIHTMKALVTKTINIKIDKIQWIEKNETIILSREYKFKNEICSFEREIIIDMEAPHDFICNKLDLIIYTTIPSSNAYLNVDLKEFYNAENFSYQKEYNLVSLTDMSKPDFYINKASVLGTVLLSISDASPDESLKIKKYDIGFAQMIAAKILGGNMANRLNMAKKALSDLFQGTLYCKVKTMIGGFITSEFGYKRHYYDDKTGDLLRITDDFHDLFDGYEKMRPEQAIYVKNILDYVIAAFLDSKMIKWTIGQRKTVNGYNNKIKRAILERVDVGEEEIHTVFEGSKDCIGFVVFIENDRAVISFRGTLTIDDLLHDLHCYYESFLNGYTHFGILKQAKFFYKIYWPNIKVAIAEKKINHVVLAGHSLGAAICAILHIMINNDAKENQGIHVKTHAFSPPPVVSKEMLEIEYNDLNIYCFGNDPITRLSFGSMCEYNYISLMLINNYNIIKGHKSLYDYYVAAKNMLRKNDTFSKLYHPGKIYHLQSKKSDGTTIYGAKIVSYNFFSDFLGFGILPFDHLLNSFLNALEYFSRH